MNCAVSDPLHAVGILADMGQQFRWEEDSCLRNDLCFIGDNAHEIERDRFSNSGKENPALFGDLVQPLVKRTAKLDWHLLAELFCGRRLSPHRKPGFPRLRPGKMIGPADLNIEFHARRLPCPAGFFRIILSDFIPAAAASGTTSTCVTA